MISFKNVSYNYPSATGVYDINFDLEKNRLVVLMGPNGSGKSTIFKLIEGLIQPNSGNLTYNNKNPDFLKLRQQVGLVFQNSSVQLFNDSVKEELAFGPQQLGLSKEEIEKRVNDIVKLLSLEKLINRVPYQLSGGEQKLVAIGSILTMNPALILLDEPLSGLSAKFQNKILNLLTLLKKAGKTILISSHNFNQIKT
ncbi:energy-coupling factor ABC transporter ATP-binding protein [Liquorilactobacillus vini]|uniref:energy-coupling factor ABC transporter ATP-binding protein n=1 Tax=Liquorilactobacillus vini TaxID=238015 RepID=UPI00031CBF37|nr:ABC transporter ATP-binding protein [Liquorilactobacillus vini]